MHLIDTTLRDGLQNPEMPEHGKYSLSITERLEIFTALVKYGVKYIELFSPTVNQTEQASLEAIIKTRNNLAQDYGYTKILIHVRANEEEINRTLQIEGIDGLNLYMGTSPQSRQFNHGKDLNQIIQTVKPLLQNLRTQYPRIELRFSGEDAFRTPLEDLFAIYDQIADYVVRFGLPDTVGIATPIEVRHRIQSIHNRYPKVGLEVHFHNDRGLSLINTLTAIESGAEYIDTSVLGLAERSGITSLTGLIFNLYLQNPDLVANFQLEQSYPLNVLVASIMNMQVPFTEPVSLTNNTHSAGVHTSAMLKNSSVYQAHPLESFGVNQTKLLLGPLCGHHVVHYYLAHMLNFITPTEDLIHQITHEFKDQFESNPHASPTDLLNQIAQKYNLIRNNKPQTHIEKI